MNFAESFDKVYSAEQYPKKGNHEMQNNKTNTNTIALTMAIIYVGIILGAGFASGAEIMAYFVEFGVGGVLGLGLACALFGLVGWAIWDICVRTGVNDYKSFMDIAMGKWMAVMMEIVLGLFMFILFSAMLAAFGASLHESFGVNYLFAVCVVAAVCFVTFLFGIFGIIKLNAYISPILIIGCVVIAVWTFVMRAEPVFAVAERTADMLRTNWYVSAITYVGYNIVGAVVILPSLVKAKREPKGKSKMIKSGVFSGIILFILGFSLYLSLDANLAQVEGVQIPMLTLVRGHGRIWSYSFLLLFLGACFTTAVTNGYAVVATIGARTNMTDAKKIWLKLIICISGIVAALMGFANFVRVIYPLFAIFGIIEIALIIKSFIALRRKI